MIRNYFKTAIRNLVRNPVYALINIFGLSIGITGRTGAGILAGVERNQ